MLDHWAISTLTPPPAEPLTLGDVKAQVRMRTEDTDQDTFLSALTLAARRHVEERIGRQLMPAKLRLTLDRFPLLPNTQFAPGNPNVMVPVVNNVWPLNPSAWAIELPRSPVQSLLAVNYVDQTGGAQSMDLATVNADLASEPARLTPASGSYWPSTRFQPAAVTIDYVAGYGVPVTVDATADTLTGPANWSFYAGQKIRVVSLAGTVPAGLTAMTDYYAVNVSGNVTKLAATAGGTAINLTDAGSGLVFVEAVPESVKVAMKLLVGHWFENRDAAGDPGPLAAAIDSILSLERLYTR